jgi:hypothetical protein
MIYYFGDSHTAGIGSDGSPKPDIWYHVPYSKYLTDLLLLESKNLAIPGQNFVLNVLELIKNLNDIEKNASIVIFQTQFFCNSILKYDDKDFFIKNLIVSSGLLGIENKQVYENLKLGITKEDSLTLLNWSEKFEERRSLYELDIVINLFNYLKTKGIQCYLLYWAPPFNINLPDNEYVIKFNKGSVASTDTEKRMINFQQFTNGEWNDYHSINEWNEFLAQKIYNFIK